MRLLKEEDVKKISYWVSQMKYVPPEVTEKAIKEFYGRLVNKISLASSGGQDYLFDVLVGLMGESRAKELVEDVSSREEHEVFNILKKVDPRQLAAYFKQERPQTVALMMSYVDPKRAAAIIAALPGRLQAEVIMCMAKMEETDPEVVEAMEKALVSNLGAIATGQNF